MTDPTAYSDLNALLEELVTSIRAILTDNLCGARGHRSSSVHQPGAHPAFVDYAVSLGSRP